MQPSAIGSDGGHERDGNPAGLGNRNVTTPAQALSTGNKPLPRFDPICPTSVFPIQLGGKWTAMIVLCLHSGPRRFGVLRRHLSPISAKVLAESLTAMERDGLVLRRPLEGAEGADGGVEYELTPLGHTLIGLIEQVRIWSRANFADLWHARESFDRAEPE